MSKFYDFTKILRIVAAREDIKDYTYALQESSEKGDGYSGSVRAIQLNGWNHELNLVVKYPHTNPAVYEQLPLTNAYAREIHFYEEIAPMYKLFQDDYKIKEPFNNAPKYYGSVKRSTEESIAMENLKAGNYRMWNRKTQMDFAHLEVTFTTYAKLHATSMALKHLRPVLFDKLTVGLTEKDISRVFMEKTEFHIKLSEIIVELDVFDNSESEYKERIEKFRTHLAKCIYDAQDYHDKYDAILHGDAWCNNVMYLYDADRKGPVDMKMIDWQLLKIGPVILDLTYFFYSIAPKEAMKDLQHFLKIYHNALTEHLKAFELNAENIYPFKEFWKQWQKLSLHGFQLAFVMRKVMLLNSEDVPDYSEGIADFVYSMKVSEDAEVLYRQQMKELIMHFVDNNFI